MTRTLIFLSASLAIITSSCSTPDDTRQISGIYPHLAMFNNDGECGIGAVVPWGGRLWAVTYSPHFPSGSGDKLYEITPTLDLIARPESLGGTPANRMIHADSGQLFIGPHAIRDDGTVRSIPYDKMPGRHTGNARHLFEPAEKIYFATMEEGLYEVDVNTLAVREHFADNQQQTGHAPRGYEAPSDDRLAHLPGYHGKGVYSGQGVVIYANNGEPTEAARRRPDIPSGSLSEWDGRSREWTVVRRNQFTEVTGPGGICGNATVDDPVWTIGWDTKSVLLGVRMPETGWTFYRLPKASHSYDGAHGWNTEWPRIREIGENALLMTMHGTFWSFPSSFTPKSSSGIRPRSNYLKVIGDFCRWDDRLVFACDDVAKREFMNRRRAKGEIAAAQSHSNLWFVEPAKLDALGPPIGRGLVFEGEDVAAGTPSDPFLFSGYDTRGLHLAHTSGGDVELAIEIDANGDGEWRELRRVTAKAYEFVEFDTSETGAWVRLRCINDAKNLTAAFTYRNEDTRDTKPSPIFEGIAAEGQPMVGGILRARAGDKRTLSFVAQSQDGGRDGYYELDESRTLRRVDDEGIERWTREHAAIPANVLSFDPASVVFVDDRGRRWRLPRGDASLGQHPLGDYRVDRELVTERDLFNAAGTFFELPSPNSGGFIKIRPVATHNRLIHDYCSYRGMTIISGLDVDASSDNRHVIRSDDGRVALWAGTIDDMWAFGKPRGVGGPWMDSAAKAGEPSDPYLMTAYDRKRVRMWHGANEPVEFTLQVDIDGNGTWADYMKRRCAAGGEIAHEFPRAFSAYWVRAIVDRDVTASVQLQYD